MKANISFQQYPSAEIYQKYSKDIINRPINTHISSEINIPSRNNQESIKPKKPFEGMKRYEPNKVTRAIKNPESISLTKENTNISNRNNKNSNIVISRFSNKKIGEKENTPASVTIDTEGRRGGRTKIYTVNTVKKENIEFKNKSSITPFNRNTVSQNRFNKKENSFNQNNIDIKQSFNNKKNDNNNITNKANIKESLYNKITYDVNKNIKTVNNTDNNIINKYGTTRLNNYNISPNLYNIKENVINKNNTYIKQSFYNKNDNNITNNTNIKESLYNKNTNDLNKNFKTINNTSINNRRGIIELKNKDGIAPLNRYNVTPNRYNIKENTTNQNNTYIKQSFNNKNNNINNFANKANLKESSDFKITYIKNISDNYNSINKNRRNTNNNIIKNTNNTSINTNNNKSKNQKNDNSENANRVEEENQNKPLSIEEQNLANEKEKTIVRRLNPNASKYAKIISNKNNSFEPNEKEKNDKKVKSIKKIKGKKNLKKILELKMKILKSIRMLKLIEAFQATSYIKSCEATSTAGRGDDGEIKTNQDTALLERNINGVSNFNLFGVLDGHGENGHLASQFACKYIINKIKYHPALRNLKSSKEIYKKLTENNYELITKIYIDADTQIAKEKFDCDMSGTTCVLVFQLDKHLICSNVGDSRAILVYEDKKSINLKNTKVFLLSNDCKPELPEEQKRIEERGGCVKQYLDEDDIPSGPFRVWIKGEFYPGIAISRSIGDLDAKKVGVIPNPLFIEYTLDEKAKYMLICSDGIWEFISNQEVMKIANSYYLKKDAYGLCQDLTKIATENWLKEDIVVDDITVVAAFFK